MPPNTRAKFTELLKAAAEQGQPYQVQYDFLKSALRKSRDFDMLWLFCESAFEAVAKLWLANANNDLRAKTADLATEVKGPPAANPTIKRKQRAFNPEARTMVTPMALMFKIGGLFIRDASVREAKAWLTQTAGDYRFVELLIKGLPVTDKPISHYRTDEEIVAIHKQVQEERRRRGRKAA